VFLYICVYSVKQANFILHINW